MITTTQGTFFILTEKTREKLELQFYPSNIGVSRKINLAELNTIAANFPSYQYMNGATEISFDVDFVSGDENRQDVLAKCRWLESLGANNGSSTPIEKVYLVFGDVFRRQKWVVKSWSYNINLFDKVYGNLPRQARGTITLAQSPDGNLNRQEIRRVL